MILWWGCGTLIGTGVALGVIPGLGHHAMSRLKAARSWAEYRAGRMTLRTSNTDLALCEISLNELVAQKLLYAVAGGMIGAVGGFTLVSFTGSSGALTVILLGTVGAIGGFVLPDVSLRSEAARRRRDFVHSFSGFLDLVNVLLAGGAGLETALVAASDAGDGPAFVSLRNALARAQTMHRSPWVELHDLGIRLGIEQLVEVAGSLQLAGEHGARVRTSLAARAESLRFRQMSEIEASANASTERMGLPMVMLFIGFLVLIGYPAITHVIGGL